MKDSQSKMIDFNARANQAAKDAAVASQEAMKKAADAAKEAATAVVRLPNTRVIEVREKCAGGDQWSAGLPHRGRCGLSRQGLQYRTTGRHPHRAEVPCDSMAVRPGAEPRGNARLKPW